jgi:hypothetical protein
LIGASCVANLRFGRAPRGNDTKLGLYDASVPYRYPVTGK